MIIKIISVYGNRFLKMNVLRIVKCTIIPTAQYNNIACLADYVYLGDMTRVKTETKMALLIDILFIFRYKTEQCGFNSV